MSGGKIYAMIPKIMRDVGAVEKTGQNTFDKYTYRRIDDVYNALQPVLANNGVFFVPQVLDSKEETITSAKGTQQVRVKLRVKYLICADDGSFIESHVEGEGIDRSDKATNKALQAAFKYMCSQVFCFAEKDTTDADEESPDLGRHPDHKAPPNPLKVAREAKAKVKADAGEFTIEFGTNHGKQLKDLKLDQIAQLATYWRERAAKETIDKKIIAFLAAAKRYLDQLESQT